MTTAAALYNFWASFGLEAYNEASVPTGDDAPSLPYITYQSASDSFGGVVPLTASVWYGSSSWVAVNAKAEQIGKAISGGGKILPCDGGAIWINKGSPFSTALSEPSDSTIKRNLINITAEFITAD